MNETVPADIAAAIDALEQEAFASGLDDYNSDTAHARARLEAAILHHLRNADEMKAALERIEQGA